MNFKTETLTEGQLLFFTPSQQMGKILMVAICKD